MDRNRVEAKIRGRFYTITANEPEEYIYKICTYVDKKITDVVRMNPSLSTEMAAVLTAINVSDELYKSRDSEDNMRSQVLAYDEEAGKYEKRVKELESEVEKLKMQLAAKEDELTKFIEQF